MTDIVANASVDKAMIKRMVLDLRRVLEKDLTAVLRQYGLFVDAEWLPLERLPLDRQEVRNRAEAALQPEFARIRATVATQEQAQPAAAAWYVREVGFTYLNRLVGLKCLEVRGLFPEVLRTRPEYSGRSLYHRDYLSKHPDQAGQADDALPAMLRSAFREVTEQIRHLFDPDSPSSIVWPRHGTLREASGLINGVPDDYWRQDDIIGWVYQFYSSEEKEAIRKRGKPIRPLDVAVINQFFTPRWVVKFLVDNTLGRLWLEMHPNSSRVRAKCNYLLPEQISEPEHNGEAQAFRLDPTSPINSAQAIARRTARSPAEIKLIDPACGTMHFGHYAFEVFTAIYQDARDLAFIEPDEVLADHEIPLAILRNNLHGVDIDLRAVQLSALSLYLKARVALHSAGVTAERARELPWRVNLVCADARLPDGGVREQFLQEYEDDPVLQRAWRELFNEMQDIARVGSLLRVEQRFSTILEYHRPPTVKLNNEGQSYIPRFEPAFHQMSFYETLGTQNWSPHRSIEVMLSHLREFARDALISSDVNAQLFAVEAAKTLSLLDVLMQDYDVVVMNPPYGETTDDANILLKSLYPEASGDLFAMFLLRGNQLTKNRHGLSGALVSSTVQSHTSFAALRRKLFVTSTQLCTMLDLGWGILDDANVEATALTYGAGLSVGATFFKLTDVAVAQRAEMLEDLIRHQPSSHDRVFVHSLSQLDCLPETTLTYWLSNRLLALLAMPSTIQTIADIKQGLGSGDNPTYYKYRWEIDQSDIGVGRSWVPLANGGEYSPYYRDITQVVYWKDNGYEIRNAKKLRGLAGTRVQNSQFYFLPGITYGKRSEFLNCQLLPADHIFSDEARGVFSRSRGHELYLLGLLNSKLFQCLLNSVAGVHKASGYVQRLPYVEPPKHLLEAVSVAARTAHDIKAKWDMGNEICTVFETPWLLRLAEEQVHTDFDLSVLLDNIGKQEEEDNQHLAAIQLDIDSAIYKIYDISRTDIDLIERELHHRPAELVWPQMGIKGSQEKRKEHVRRLLSYFILQTLKAEQDGLIPLVKETGEQTMLARLRTVLEERFGDKTALQLEDWAAQVLGKSLATWLDVDYSKWHTQLYKNRPIVWQLTSERGAFACLLYYHRLDGDTLQKVRTVYLAPLLRRVEEGAWAALERKDLKTASAREETADELRTFDQRLSKLIALGYAPVINDGVKKNIWPLQEAGIMRPKKIV